MRDDLPKGTRTMSDSATKPEDLPPVPMIQQRRIEAAILKHVYDILKAPACATGRSARATTRS
jgi:hypothetical protein